MNSRRTTHRERRRMILLSIHEVAKGTTRPVAYEDVVVAAWKLFPPEFGLRGYVEKYPDSSELHRPLYGALERDGLVRVQRYKLALTESGLAAAERLRELDGAQTVQLDRVRRGQRLGSPSRPRG
jgi:hypothetical protein